MRRLVHLARPSNSIAITAVALLLLAPAFAVSHGASPFATQQERIEERDKLDARVKALRAGQTGGGT